MGRSGMAGKRRQTATVRQRSMSLPAAHSDCPHCCRPLWGEVVAEEVVSACAEQVWRTARRASRWL